MSVACEIEGDNISNARSFAILLGLALLYFFLDSLLGSIFIVLGGVYLNFRIAGILIPLSIVFGWPAIFGLTLGSILSLYYSSFMWLGDFVIVLGIFAAGFLAMKVGRLRMNWSVNIVAFVGAILGLASLLFPWWSFKAAILEQNLVAFSVYPGWFEGELGSLIDIMGRIVGTFIPDPVSPVLNSLALTLWLVGGGSIIAMIGAFLRDLKGRVMIAGSLALCLIGIVNMYTILSQTLSTVSMPISGSKEFSWMGTTLALADWGWVAGMYLSVIATIVLVIAIIVHNHMLEIKPSKFLACTTATFLLVGFRTLHFIFFKSQFHEELTTLDISLCMLGNLLFDFFTISIIGYAIVSNIRNRE